MRPGQNLSARARAAGVQARAVNESPRADTTKNRLVRGRRLSVARACTAPSRTVLPSPYTVAVG